MFGHKTDFEPTETDLKLIQWNTPLHVTLIWKIVNYKIPSLHFCDNMLYFYLFISHMIGDGVISKILFLLGFLRVIYKSLNLLITLYM